MSLLSSRRARLAAFTLFTALAVTGITDSAALAAPASPTEELPDPAANSPVQALTEQGDAPAAGETGPPHTPAPSTSDTPAVTPRASGTLRVTSGADSGPGTLRDAAETANLDETPDTITFDPGLIITLETTVELLGSTALLGDSSDPALIRPAEGLSQTEDPQLLTTRSGFDSAADLRIEFLALSGEHNKVRGLYIEAFGLNEATIQDVTMRDFGLPAVDGWSTDATALTISRLSLTGSGGKGEDALSFNTGYGTFVSVTDSLFSDNPGRVFFRHNQSSETDNFRFSNNTFSGGGEDAEHCLAIDTWVVFFGIVPEVTTLEFTENTVTGCRASDSAVFLARSLEGDDTGEYPRGILVENNSFSNNQASGNVEPLADSLVLYVFNPVQSYFDVAMQNNTFSGDDRALPQAHLGFEFPGSSALATHNTFVGGGLGVSTGSLIENRAAGGYSLTVENNVFDTGATPALIEQIEDGDHLELLGAGNATTTPGEAFPDDTVTVLTRAEMALAPLSENGTQTGTLTRMPKQGSLLIDAGTETGHTPATDQRGLPRLIGNAPDIGAVETEYAREPAVLTLASDVTVREGSDAVFTVSRTGAAGEAVSVNVATSPGTATADVDYTHTEALLEWAADDMTPKTFTVETIADEAVRDKRAFTVTLASPSEHAEIGDPASVTGTITDTSTAKPPTEEPGGQQPPNGTKPPLSNTGAASGLPALAIAAALLLGGGFLLRRRTRTA